MPYIVYDLAIVVILVLFALWGMRKGLILSLCSLAAVVVAFVGGVLLCNLWAPSVAGWVQPTITPAVTEAVHAALPDGAADAQLSLDKITAALDGADLPMGLNEFIADLLKEGAPTLSVGATADGVISFLAEKLALAIAYAGLFLVCFVLILILWYFLAHTLDLVARLPGLHMLNKAGGLVFGLFRGALLLFACTWILRWLGSGLIPPEATEQTSLLRFFMTFNPLKYLANI